jgi:hypothetical protein
VNYGRKPASKRAEITRHVPELPNHLGVAEIASGRVASAAECNGADVAIFARRRFRAHYCGVGVEAFGWFAGRNAVISRNERQRDVIGDFRHTPTISLFRCRGPFFSVRTD